jgi:hypothetical protein
MTLKCYNKPNRKNPRYFSACDCARIAKQVIQDRNLTPEQVLACVAKNLGFTHISLSRQASAPVEASVDLAKATTLIRIFILGVERIAKIFHITTILKRIGPILEALDVLEELLEDIFDAPRQEPVDDVVDDSFCKCKEGK